MASLASHGSWLVVEDHVPSDGLFERVARGARDLLVAAPQRKSRPVVIEEGRSPFCTVVTGCAVVFSCAKLPRVRVIVLMTVFASAGRACEPYMTQSEFHVGRLVAIGACYGTMSPYQWKARRLMVKLRQIFPFLRGVACLAAKGLSRGIVDRHAHRELAFMYVLVTARAAERIEVIWSCLQTWCRLVAFVAGHSFVSPGQRETGLLVLCERVICTLEGCAGVALLTAVAPWNAGELAGMLILVAINTEQILQLELCLFACRDMAGGARHCRMRKDQGKASLRVIRKRECRGAPARDGVTTFAAATVGALQKLSPVRIGLMAICAGVVGNRRLKVSTLVTRQAWDIQMFTEQRKVCLRVVKGSHEAGLLPGRGVVAGIASLLELAFMRILMTIRTVGESDSCVARLAVGSRSVAAGTLHRTVLTGKWEAGSGVVEVLAIDRRCLPVGGRVAVRAIGPESALVMVHVASDAVGHQAEPGAIQVLAGEQRACLRGNMLWGVTGTAAHAYMFAFEWVAGFRMVEPLWGWVPVQHLEINAIVI